MPRFFYTLTTIAVVLWFVFIKLLASVPPTTNLVVVGVLLYLFFLLTLTASLVIFVFAIKHPQEVKFDNPNKRFLYRRGLRKSVAIALLLILVLVLRMVNFI